jgi:sporulation protein YlmC with PRC-barrel domain
MDDLGPPVSHLALRDGVPVYDNVGERVGVVDRVMTDEATGIFEGLIIHTLPVIGGRHLFASHEQIAELRERGVRLATGRAELHELDESAGRRRGGDRSAEPQIEAVLRKAWDWLTARPR